jgi:hypothetical protein
MPAFTFVVLDVASLLYNLSFVRDHAEMDLHPHLHLMVPSNTAGAELEARLYISKQLIGQTPTPPNGFSTSSSSTPVPVSSLDQDTLTALKNIDRLVIASHPWGRFGGNMLYPYVHLFYLS